jgi:hypothetical protein
MAVKSGSTERLYVGGTLVQTVTGKLAAIANTQSAGKIGHGYNNSYFAGDIAEVLVYNRALTDTERAQLEQHLKAKYALGP